MRMRVLPDLGAKKYGSLEGRKARKASQCKKGTVDVCRHSSGLIKCASHDLVFQVQKLQVEHCNTAACPRDCQPPDLACRGDVKAVVLHAQL